jgi:predicted HAD superfamily hydrolase/glycosyltransferase involved in cell wall biosynthesis
MTSSTEQTKEQEILALLDLAWYEKQSGQKWDSLSAAIAHYNSTGWRSNLDPHPLFSTTFYLDSHPDVRQAGVSPLVHFVLYGHHEGRDPHPMFSTSWYRAHYLSNAPTLNPLSHFIVRGAKLRNNPNADFDAAWYARRYGNQIAENMNPLVHFISMGAQLGFARNPSEEWVVAKAAQNSQIEQALKDGHAPPILEIAQNEFPIDEQDLEGIELISFDVWDTLLRRDCHPDEIKLQSARFVYLSFYWSIRPAYRNILSLFRRRLQVENSAAPKRDFEYRFSDAAILWLHDIMEPSTLPAQIDAAVKAVIRHEFQAESRSIRTDKPAQMFLHNNSSIPAVFASDFYLDSAAIGKLLDHHGYAGNFVRGFSSSETFQNKRSGELFKKILHDFSMPPAKVLHIGDNIKADFEIPRSLGMKAALYTQPGEEYQKEEMRRAHADHLAGNAEIHTITLRENINELSEKIRREQNKSNEVEGVDVSVIAVGFVLNIIETALRFGVDSIYFFTREGQFLKHLYELVVDLDPYNIPHYPKPRLLEVSRVATFAASLRSLKKSELMRIWSQYSSQSLRSFSRSLDFDVKLLEATANRFGLHVDEVVSMPWDDARFMGVLEDEDVSQTILSHIERQRAILLQYLDQAGFLNDEPTAVVVDIGWRGTIQDNLCQITKKHIHGCYLGLFGYLNPQARNSSKHGWLADYNVNKFGWGSQEVAPLEMLFNSPGGSVTGYKKVGNRIRAEKLKLQAEDAVIEKYIQPIQSGISSAARIICEYVRLHGLVSDDLQDFALATVRKLLSHPSKKIAHAFFSLEHNEVFGTGEAVLMGTAEASISKLLDLSGAQLHATAKAALDECRWKSGFFALASVQAVYRKLSTTNRRSLPVEFWEHLGPKVKVKKDRHLRLAIYAPPPLIGSGGHRTIFNLARRAYQYGFELYIFLEGEGDGIKCVAEYLQGVPANISIGWNVAVPVDFALATIAHSAEVVAKHPCKSKGYLVQDFEAGFNPLSDGYVAAENSYCEGLQHFTVGNWLSHVLSNQYSASTVPAGLGVDTSLYRPSVKENREDAVCFLYQPEKPRRMPRLGIESLRLLKQKRPQTKIYVYGSDLPLTDTGFDVINLGLITDLKLINDLYNKCRVGLCISLSNPSRIPFEMMAAGTVPVDVYRYNNLLDHDGDTTVLAFQGAASIAKAMCDLLEDTQQWKRRSTNSIARAKSRSLDWEKDVICNNMIDIIAGRVPEPIQVSSKYSVQPVIADEEKNENSLAFCRWQRSLAG